MVSRRKEMQLRQKAYFEQKLKDRLAFLSGKGIEPPKADKDPLVKKLKANVRAMNRRLRLIAGNEKITEEMAKIKADRAAALLKEKEGGQVEKPKKAAEEGKGKKPKTEKKAAPPKAPESGQGQKAAEAPVDGKSQKAAEAPEAGKAPKKKKTEEPIKEPATESPAGQEKIAK